MKNSPLFRLLAPIFALGALLTLTVGFSPQIVYYDALTHDEQSSALTLIGEAMFFEYGEVENAHQVLSQAIRLNFNNDRAFAIRALTEIALAGRHVSEPEYYSHLHRSIGDWSQLRKGINLAVRFGSRVSQEVRMKSLFSESSRVCQEEAGEWSCRLPQLTQFRFWSLNEIDEISESLQLMSRRGA